MAYSEDVESSRPIHDYVKENSPGFIFISRKECHHDCFIFDPVSGRIVAGEMKKSLGNHDILQQITSPGFSWNPKKKGFGLSDSGLFIALIDRAEIAISYYSNHGKEDHKAKDYLRAWRLELQELRGEI